jgi:hypothetical protein
MAFDGNGNWIPEFSAKEDRDAGVKILASRFDDVFQQDLKESFEKCLTNDGQNVILNDFNFNNNKGINIADPVEESDVVNLRKLTNTINNMLNTLYPVGSLYIGTQNFCPLENLISGSSWTLVAENRALWGGNGSNGNTTIEAGLPNIVGKSGGFEGESTIDGQNGAIKTISIGNGYGGGANRTYHGIEFNASWSNQIYGRSNTVQPPAYRVNVWRRTK